MDNNIIDKRTKGEWKFDFDDSTHTGLNVFAGEEKIIDFVMGGNLSEAEANAAFIVKACNEYDKLKEQNAVLLKSLKEITVQFDKVVNPKYTWDDILIRQSHEAIKKCEPLT